MKINNFGMFCEKMKEQVGNSLDFKAEEVRRDS
jgi:hypothetical protein